MTQVDLGIATPACPAQAAARGFSTAALMPPRHEKIIPENIPARPLAAAHAGLLSGLTAMGVAAPISLRLGADADDIAARGEHLFEAIEHMRRYLVAVAADTVDNMSCPERGVVAAIEAYCHDMRAETAGALLNAAGDMAADVPWDGGDLAEHGALHGIGGRI